MSSSGPYCPTDPLGDELAQIEKLDELAEKYGWDADSKEYLKRLTLIQKAGAKALKMAAGPARGGGGAASHPSFGKPKKWAVVKKEKHANKESARAMLKKEQSGPWVQDGSCPKSKAEGGLPGYRFVNKVAVGGPYLLRLVDLMNGSWRMDRPVFDEKDSESDEDSDLDADDDDKPKPSVASGEAATESQEAPEEAAPAAATPKKPAARRGSKRGRH